MDQNDMGGSAADRELRDRGITLVMPPRNCGCDPVPLIYQRGDGKPRGIEMQPVRQAKGFPASVFGQGTARPALDDDLES